MVSPVLEKELHEELAHLPLGQQRQVLDFARALAVTQVRGVAGSKLLPLAGTIAPDDLEAMAVAIQEDCEKVNANDW